MIDFAASRQPQGYGAGRSPARVWLKGLNLEVYANAFLLAGYDSYEVTRYWRHNAVLRHRMERLRRPCMRTCTYVAVRLVSCCSP